MALPTNRLQDLYNHFKRIAQVSGGEYSVKAETILKELDKLMGKILSPNQQIDNKERHQQVHELVRQASYSNQLLKYNTTRYLVAEFEVKMSKKGEVPVEGVLLLWNDCIIFAQEEPNKGVSCGDKNLLCLFVLMLVDIRDIQKIQDSETQFFLFLEASTFEISFSSGIDSHAFQDKLSFWKTIGYTFSEKKYFLSAGSTFIFFSFKLQL